MPAYEEWLHSDYSRVSERTWNKTVMRLILYPVVEPLERAVRSEFGFSFSSAASAVSTKLGISADQNSNNTIGTTDAQQ